ncbi:unnamed protein product [Toxocara canis]|uniref:RME-8_N domain-containing protein n=1 Tax=Toxocara canis TaxID=6265 RepID=A0A183UVQ2_TOXCA|nr:unnamed protein product [Toxocara canis]
MASFCADNRDVACFLVTKHSWKGKYKRIFSIGSLAISTYNPSTLEITNQWLYEDFVMIRPAPRSGPGPEEFVIQMRSKRKNDTMRFSSEYTQQIITETLAYQWKFADAQPCCVKFSGYKHGWSDQRVPVILQVTAFALQQIDSRQIVVATYKYRDIRQIIKMTEYPGGFVLEMDDQRRRHLLVAEKCDELIALLRRMAGENIGVAIPLAKETLTLDDFMQTRLGMCSRDEQVTSYVEFRVQKLTRRQDYPVRRLLCLSESCIVERDLASYAAVCARALKSVRIQVFETC